MQRECKSCWAARTLRNKRARQARRDARRARIQDRLDALDIKTCARCKTLKVRQMFSVDRGRRDGLNPYCKTCQGINARAAVAKHGRKPPGPNSCRPVAKRHVQSLKAAPCNDCGMTWPPKVMHFHHIDPSTKTASLAHLVSLGRPIEELDAEIAKCILLCANCHAMRHDGGEG